MAVTNMKQAMNPMKNPYFAFALVMIALGIIVPVVYMLVSNPSGGEDEAEPL